MRWISSIDAAMPPVSSRCTRVIRVDDALCGAARCRHIALCQRGVGAFEVIVVPALVDLQADRIGRVIGLGPSRRRFQNRHNRQDRQSQKAHRKSPFLGITGSPWRRRRNEWQTPFVATDACDYGPCFRRDHIAKYYAERARAPSIMAIALAMP